MSRLSAELVSLDQEPDEVCAVCSAPLPDGPAAYADGLGGSGVEGPVCAACVLADADRGIEETDDERDHRETLPGADAAEDLSHKFEPWTDERGAAVFAAELRAAGYPEDDDDE